MPALKHRPEDFQDKTFGRLTTISYEMKSSGVTQPRMKRYWLCQCSCGKTCHRWETSLRASETPNCGCVVTEASARHQNHPQFRGYGEIGSTYYTLLKWRCKKSGRELPVSIEYLWQLFLAQNRLCALTGLPLTFANYRSGKRSGAEQTASVDRIDSSKGYVEGNVQWVHKDINLMKNHFDQDHFVEMCRRIAAKFPAES